MAEGQQVPAVRALARLSMSSVITSPISEACSVCPSLDLLGNVL